MDPAIYALILTYTQTKDPADLATVRTRAEELGDPHVIEFADNLQAMADGRERRIATPADHDPLLTMIPAFLANDVSGLRDAARAFPPDSVTGNYLRCLLAGDVKGLHRAIRGLRPSYRIALLVLAVEAQQEMYESTGDQRLRKASVRHQREATRLREPRPRWWRLTRR
ncbi:hypothetical protein GT755_10880 [Herbidospora sp. NEAU-GS84]|uniref:Uncharacterized protein n=1 Tax=Herbidospora solisilvae TaxID=2696284 RepID=A0A7C9J1W0_9ACTN|nr:hypothetical protein [Herbidospora solisilvae]NAS22186.1 hypothetical protein [Herbidospora solisilvae]